VPATATPTTGTAGSLAESVRRATAGQTEWPLVLQPRGPGWTRCAELLADPAGWARRVADRLRTEYGEAPDRVIAGYLLSWHLTVPARTGALLFRTARRVPELGPADLAVRFGGDARPAAVALLADRFACLPGDPGADRPEATVVPDEPALAALLRARYESHAREFLAAFGTWAPGRRLGRRTLWATATDALDGACWRVGQSLRAEAAGAADAALVLPAALPPFTSASTLRPDSTGGWTRRRDSCCFHYVLRAGMGTCATCPRLCDR
jgi:hypothetical protein